MRGAGKRVAALGGSTLAIQKNDKNQKGCVAGECTITAEKHGRCDIPKREGEGLSYMCPTKSELQAWVLIGLKDDKSFNL